MPRFFLLSFCSDAIQVADKLILELLQLAPPDVYLSTLQKIQRFTADLPDVREVYEKTVVAAAEIFRGKQFLCLA